MIPAVRALFARSWPASWGLIHQPRCRQRQALARIGVGVWLVEDNAPPSVTAFANERTISLPAPSRPIVIVKPDEAVVVCSLAAAFAPAVAGHQAQALFRERTGNEATYHGVKG